MAETKVFKVGIVIGSTRVVRIGPQVANFVLNTIKAAEQNPLSSNPPTQRPVIFDIVDIATHKLPIFDEPGIPQHIKSTDGYTREHTRAWSRRIEPLDGFIFISTQRNWGIPAELKNAIDYLFHEWKGKPAIIVTYGGHGGHQCAAQLKTVLGAIGVRVGEKMVGMAFPSPEFRSKSFKGEDLGLDASNDEGPWAEHKGSIVAAWDELLRSCL